MTSFEKENSEKRVQIKLNNIQLNTQNQLKKNLPGFFL
jgi:hypothetical protein